MMKPTPLQASAPPPLVVAPRDVPITASDVDSDPIAAVTQGVDWAGMLRHPERLAAFIAPALDRSEPVTVDAIRSALLDLVGSFPEPKARSLARALDRARATLSRWRAQGNAERVAYWQRRVFELMERLDAELGDPLLPLRAAISDAVRLLETPAFARYVSLEVRAWIAAHD